MAEKEPIKKVLIIWVLVLTYLQKRRKSKEEREKKQDSRAKNQVFLWALSDAEKAQE